MSISDAEIDGFHTRPVASYRDLQLLYGQLAAHAEGISDYETFLSRDRLADLEGKPDSLVEIRLAIDGGDKTVELETDPVRVHRLDSQIADRIGYSRNSASRGIDYALSHLTGSSSGKETRIDWALRLFTKWPTMDSVKIIAGRHPDGWLLNAIERLGEDDQFKTTLRAELDAALSEGEQSQLFAVRFEPRSTFGVELIGEETELAWPGELAVIRAVTEEVVVGDLASRNRADDARGETTSFLTGEHETVLGTAEDPMQLFSSKVVASFPALDANASWRSHPIGVSQVPYIQLSEAFLDACYYNRAGLRIYQLPYFEGRHTPNDLTWLLGLLSTQASRAATADDEEARTPAVIQTAYQRREDAPIDEERLRFYTLVIERENTVAHVLRSEAAGRLLSVVEVANQHRRVIDGPLYGGSGQSLFSAFDDVPYAMESTSDTDLVEAIGSLSYVLATFADRREHGTTDEAVVGDARFETTLDIIAGKPIPISRLFEEYSTRLGQVERNQDSTFRAVKRRLGVQYAQFAALRASSLVQSDDPLLSTPPTYMTTESTDLETLLNDLGHEPGESLDGASRAELFEAFIDTHPELEDPRRRAVFALGALCGHVHGLQRHENISRTVLDQYTIDDLSKMQVRRYVADLIAQNQQYSRINSGGKNHGYYGEVLQELVETLQADDPSTWSLTNDDLRFHYALGTTFAQQIRFLGRPTAQADEAETAGNSTEDQTTLADIK